MKDLPSTGYVSQSDIIGQKAVTHEQAAENRRLKKGIRRPRPAITPLIPISPAKFWADIKAGRLPAGEKFGRRTLWRVNVIRALAEGGLTAGGRS